MAFHDETGNEPSGLIRGPFTQLYAPAGGLGLFGVASCDDEYCCDTGVSLAFAIEPPLDPPDDEPPPPLDEPVTVMVALNVLPLLSVIFK